MKLAQWVESLNADRVVCTHKDLVKIAVNQIAGRPLRAVLVGLDFLSGQTNAGSQIGTAARPSPSREMTHPPTSAAPEVLPGWSTVRVADKACDIFEPRCSQPARLCRNLFARRT